MEFGAVLFAESRLDGPVQADAVGRRVVARARERHATHNVGAQRERVKQLGLKAVVDGEAVALDAGRHAR